MNNFKFVLNKKGVAELMKSAQMQNILTEKASAISDRCGSGYEHDVYVGKNRANAMVKTSTFAAKKDNLKNNTLLKAVH
ncbi:hypothetical protein ACWOA0_05850 [Ignavigranum ruoffiae]|nr:hypothetical protein [Ignavigranum ruoffiae]